MFNHQSERTLGLGLDKALGAPSIHGRTLALQLQGQGREGVRGGTGRARMAMGVLGARGLVTAQLMSL